MDSQCWVRFWKSSTSPIPLIMLPGIANAAPFFPVANIAIKNNPPNPITIKGHRKPQSKLRKTLPTSESKPKPIRSAPPINAPILERFVCIFFLLSKHKKLSGLSPALDILILFTQKRCKSCNQFIRRRTFVNECRASFLCGSGIIGVYAEQDNSQVGIGALKQATSFRCGRTVESPIKQEQIGRSICKRADQSLDAIHFDNFIRPQFSSE